MSYAFLAEASTVESAIVLYGRMHVKPLRDSLQKSGHTVDVHDLSDESWYVEDWFDHRMKYCSYFKVALCAFSLSDSPSPYPLPPPHPS